MGAETTEPKEVRGMEKLILPNIIENNDEIKETKNIDHEGSKRKVKENHDSHRFSQREAFSNKTKDDDNEENDKIKIKDHEGSKRKVKENHDSHRINQREAFSNKAKDDDTKENDKIKIKDHEGSKRK